MIHNASDSFAWTQFWSKPMFDRKLFQCQVGSGQFHTVSFLMLVTNHNSKAFSCFPQVAVVSVSLEQSSKTIFAGKQYRRSPKANRKTLSDWFFNTNFQMLVTMPATLLSETFESLRNQRVVHKVVDEK